MGLWLTAPAGIEAQIHPEVVEEVVVTGRWIPGRPVVIRERTNCRMPILRLTVPKI